jgi:hypothetical protein
MNRLWILFVFFFLQFPGAVTSGNICSAPAGYSYLSNEDSIENQILYNGRLWRNLYYRVVGNQFLFTDELLQGTVTIEGWLFENVLVKYDILEDELVARHPREVVGQLNKEKIDGFTIKFDNRVYDFLRIDDDSLNNPTGYVNVLLKGHVSLWIKYRKEVVMLGFEGRLDKFNQLQRIYLVKEGNAYPVKSKNDIIRLLSDRKQEINDFIRKNRLKITNKDPDSFIPVLKFYNELNSIPGDEE